ncbi:phlebovirus glycoprotein g2 domain-containing protein [Ditylenchus destructor]|uniref:Phlebovirus glycoprotein g2 domain-containing protein n=1 Tax=Ditylenchus destructor TaxID=166010 RepID=A0AAD4MI89_9BILA|nr:phlebovirus glycoprotein g2 domain-containing protein [Ditylenchus destructor]
MAPNKKLFTEHNRSFLRRNTVSSQHRLFSEETQFLLNTGFSQKTTPTRLRRKLFFIWCPKQTIEKRNSRSFQSTTRTQPNGPFPLQNEKRNSRSFQSKNANAAKRPVPAPTVAATTKLTRRAALSTTVQANSWKLHQAQLFEAHAKKLNRSKLTWLNRQKLLAATIVTDLQAQFRRQASTQQDVAQHLSLSPVRTRAQMSAFFKKQIEPLFNRLHGYTENATTLINRRHGNRGADANPEEGAEPQPQLTDEEYSLNVRALQDRIQDAVSQLDNINNRWGEYMFSRTGAELTKANEDYSSFLIGEKHFSSLIDEGREAIIALRQSLPIPRQADITLDQSRRSSSFNLDENQPEERPEPRVSNTRPQANFYDAATASNPDIAVQDIVVNRLKARYGNHKAIAETLQAELIRLPRATEGTASLRSLSESIERICRQMSAMRLPDDQPMITMTIKSKLPHGIRTELVKQERAAGGNWNTTQLRDGLEEIIAIREEVQRTAFQNDDRRDKHDSQKQQQSRKNRKTKRRRHNALICSKRDQTNKAAAHVVVNNSDQHTSTVSTVTSTAQLSEPREVLLMAKEATVTSSNGNKRSNAMIFFDCGSQTSFITHDLAKKLDLKKLSDGMLEVYAFQQQPVKFQSPKYSIKINLLDGQSVEVHKQREPEILIGMADFWQFLKKVEQIQPHLYLITTTIGPILCGQTQLSRLNQTESTISNVAIGTSFPLTQSNLRAFRFTRVFFGNIASPFLTSATILHHLSKYNSPLAIELGKNMYVDNALMAAKSPEEAVHKYRESKQIFLEAGMNLREYISNSPEVNNAIAEKDHTTVSLPATISSSTIEPLLQTERFSSWTKLTRTTAYVLRFLRIRLKTEKFQKNTGSVSGPLRAEEIDNAQHYLLLNHQKSTEISQKDIANFKLFLGSDGLYRVSSRIHNADLPENSKTPIFLHRKTRLASLIIQHCHEKSHHAGVNSTLTKFLSEFWILHARKEVRKVTDSCTTSFLNAFRRFVARREFADFYSNQRITWKFTPAFSPWFGSIYERLNALMKDAFKKVIGRKVLSLEELQTFVAEVESTMNNRPLSYVGTEADSPMPLRPVDFIQPKSTIILNAVRTAKVLMPNKHILTRPINRLYSLEVTEETFAEPEVTEETSAEPQKSPTPKETDCGITQETGRYNFRDRTKLKIPQKALFYTLITMLALAKLGSALPLETNSTCSTCEVKCSKYGVKAVLPSHITKAEICCQGDDCQLFHQERAVNFKLPDSLLVNDYSCSVHLWQKQSKLSRAIELTCPAKHECDLINCYICSRRFENPECLPTATTIAYGIGISITLIALFMLIKLLKDVFTTIFCCFSGLACVGKCFSRIFQSRKRTQTRSDSDDEPLIQASKRKQSKFGFRLTRIRPFSFSSRRMAMGIIVLATLITVTEQCSEVISINAKEERCDILKNETRCTISDTTEITLLPAGQTVCLYMKGIKGENMGTIKLRMDHVKITCLPKAELATRSYVMKVQPSHRCPKRGLCEEDYCSTVTTSTLVKEDDLEEANKYPGNSYCRDSCSTWDCTPICALPTASCLFYRTFAVPTTDTVYETFSCPDWRYGVEVFLQTEINSTVENVNVSLIEGLTSHWKDISMSTVSITRPPAPVFSRQFITDGINTAMIDKFASHLFCPNASAAESFSCEVSPEACTNCQQAVTKEGVTVSCHCRDQQIEEIIDNPNFRLPTMAGRYEVKNKGKEVFTESHHTPVQLIVKIDSMKVIAAIEGSTCNIKPYNLSGCYRCDTGGEFHFECSTDFGQALATVKCSDNTFFTQSCNKTALQYSTVLHFTEADINTNCTVECPGGNTQFYLQGQLQYIPISQQVEFLGKHGKDDTDDNFPCLLNICIEDFIADHITKFFMSWYYLPLLGIIILISGLIIGCFIRFNPIFRLWKSSYRLISFLTFFLVISSILAPLEAATNNETKHPQFGEAYSADNDSHEMRQISINGREIHSDIIFSQTVKFHSSILLMEMSKKAAKIARIEAALAKAREEDSDSQSDSNHYSGSEISRSEVGEFVSHEAIEVRGKKRVKELRCSACKNFGHIRRSKNCPMKEKNQPACPTRPLPPGKTPPVSAATPEEDEEERAVALLKAGEEELDNSRSAERDSEKKSEEQSLESNEKEEKRSKHSSHSSQNQAEKGHIEQHPQKKDAAAEKKSPNVQKSSEKKRERTSERNSSEKGDHSIRGRGERTTTEKSNKGEKTFEKKSNEINEQVSEKQNEQRRLGDRRFQVPSNEDERKKTMTEKKTAIESYVIPKLDKGWQRRIHSSVVEIAKSQIMPQREVPPTEELKLFVREEVNRKMETLQHEMRQMQRDMARTLENAAAILRNKGSPERTSKFDSQDDSQSSRPSTSNYHSRPSDSRHKHRHSSRSDPK